jgi:hypothetical protein
MPDATSNERHKGAMRLKDTTNLNTSGKDGVPVCSRKQATNVTKTANRPGIHPYDNRK